MDRAQVARLQAAQTKRERSHASVLAAATRKFSDNGWLPTTVDAIAEEAGLGTATVYKHFPNKNVIAGLVFRPVVADLLDDDRWLDDAVPARDALADFIEELSARARGAQKLTVAFLEAVNDSTARRGAEITDSDPRYWVPLPPMMTAIIRRGQDSDGFLAFPAAIEAGPLLVNLLLLRVLTRPDESAADTARLMLTISRRIFGLPEAETPLS